MARVSDNGLPSVDRTAEDIEWLCGIGDRVWWAVVPFILCFIVDIEWGPVWLLATPLLVAQVGAVLYYVYPGREHTR
jgi:hypothetical protein